MTIPTDGDSVDDPSLLDHVSPDTERILSIETSGQSIKRIRLGLGPSQVALARLLGVTNVTVNRWEHDRVRPDSSVLESLQRLS